MAVMLYEEFGCSHKLATKFATTQWMNYFFERNKNNYILHIHYTIYIITSGFSEAFRIFGGDYFCTYLINKSDLKSGIHLETPYKMISTKRDIIIKELCFIEIKTKGDIQVTMLHKKIQYNSEITRFIEEYIVFKVTPLYL